MKKETEEGGKKLKIKKVLVIIISLIMILNILIPTVALATEGVVGKTENNIIDKNTKEEKKKTTNNMDIENKLENENYKTVMEKSTDKEVRGNSISELQTLEEKGMLNIDTPILGTTYYSEETSSINVTGWKMVNVSNTYIKAYVDGKEVNSEKLIVKKLII